MPETLAAPGGDEKLAWLLTFSNTSWLAKGLSKNMEAPRKHTCVHHDHVEKQVLLSHVKGRARVWRGQWIGR